ncbi:alpha/beta-hydrolase [Pseudovirgaria hyperparasitica]|uniref:Alpha/beta-hydrolase n=1 Tax=Pseudovirgaria hyperparasitica TaxID=470096 RepID=A0A6A6WL12_9PEZI|nr:alpha/beta-hydrolase [Pseudovirgaria hyperparasitica]KAF2762867.1 alpha/beta-hydrolase [Pseudovirgaria hyperparasitica]
MQFYSLALTALTAAAVNAQTAVSGDVYNNIVRYSNFAAAAYANNCPKPPSGSTILKFFNGTATNTQAYLFRDTAAKELVLAFRGTSTPLDLDTDFLFTLTQLTLPGTSCSGCQVHQGFQDAYASIANDVSNTVTSALSSNSGYKLTVTGHSLGGGLASLASTSLAAQGKQLSVYTFGEPRNGNPAFSTYIQRLIPTSRYFRVTHQNDGVPQIPPQLLGFQHHGTEYWESAANGQVSQSNTYICSGQEPTGCSQAQDFGDNPINGAHIQYSNLLLASSLYNVGCGYKFP